MGEQTICFRLRLRVRLETSKLLKSPRSIILQSGYLFRMESIVFIKYSSRLTNSSAVLPGGGGGVVHNANSDGREGLGRRVGRTHNQIHSKFGFSSSNLYYTMSFIVIYRKFLT